VPRSLIGSAVAGGLAAAGPEFVDGTLDELTQPEQFVDLLLGVGQQRVEGQPQAAGAIRSDGQGIDLLFMLYTINT
jgi:hypothetical protein